MAIRPANTVRDGVDLSERVADPARMAATHVPGGGPVTFVVRYVSPNTSAHPSKQLSHQELADCRAANLAVCVVWETTADRAGAGYHAGSADARQAARVVESLAMPPDMPIYWAIDYDASGSAVEPYARGWVDVIGAARCGAYGGIKPLSHLLDRGLIRFAWQTFAWSSGQLDHRAEAYQYSNDHNLAGNSVDLNSALTADYGQWEPTGDSGDRGIVMSEVDLTDAAVEKIVAKLVATAPANEQSDSTVTVRWALRQAYHRTGYLANTWAPSVDQKLAAILEAIHGITGGPTTGVTQQELAAAYRAAADLLDPPTTRQHHHTPPDDE